MQKRKFKLNILDVAIVVIVICAVVALFFHDTIGDIFEKPDIVVLQMKITSDGGDTAKEILTVGNNVVIQTQTDTNAVVFQSDGTNAGLKFNGYKKLGRYYTENGDPIDIGNEYAVLLGDARINCRVESVETTP